MGITSWEFIAEVSFAAGLKASWGQMPVYSKSWGSLSYGSKNYKIYFKIAYGWHIDIIIHPRKIKFTFRRKVFWDTALMRTLLLTLTPALDRPSWGRPPKSKPSYLYTKVLPTANSGTDGIIYSEFLWNKVPLSLYYFNTYLLFSLLTEVNLMTC